MVRPVTAQRTKSPGVRTCTSSARYLSLASPLKPMLRSKRFITAWPPASSQSRFSHLSVGSTSRPALLQQFALLFVALRALRACCHLALATFAFRRYMAIGELDVQTFPRAHVCGAAEHAPLSIAHEGEAAREHIVIAERVEELGARIEALSRPRH